VRPSGIASLSWASFAGSTRTRSHPILGLPQTMMPSICSCERSSVSKAGSRSNLSASQPLTTAAYRRE
jgi:hypothetical protein